MEIVLASGNRGKLAEFADLFKGTYFSFRLMADFPEVSLPEETGETFEENALLKAGTVSVVTGRVALADDSGLVVDALNGSPGVYSARYAGEGASDGENNEKLLNAMATLPVEERSAAFVCLIAVVAPDGRSFTASGRCEGRIVSEPRGDGGFGYDPLFYVEKYGSTMAELSNDQKNEISHRGEAVRQIRERLPAFLAASSDVKPHK